MLKILILEDQAHKLKKITQIIGQIPEIDVNKIFTVTNSHDVKLKLASSSFDLFILDLAVPPRFDREIEIDGGDKLLKELVLRIDKFNLPEHIIGITGYQEVFEKSIDFFSNNCTTLIHFDETNNDWSEQLINGIKRIIDAKKGLQPDALDYKSKLAIICALQKPELKEVLNLNWNWYEEQHPNDATRYHKGHYEKDDQKFVVYAAAASRMGMPATAILASKMIANFKPEYLAMIGITAGVQGETNYGDIIVAETVWDWGSGKWTISDDKKISFLPDPHHLQLSIDLRSKFLKLQENVQAFATIRQQWRANKPNTELKLLIGAVASGSAVIADGQTITQIRSQHRKLLGVEMETYSLFASAVEAKLPRPTAFSLKSVVDFGDTSKDDDYQSYASYTSAQALKLFMEQYL